MAKRRRVRADRVLILILAFILIVLLVVLGIKYLFSDNNSSTENLQQSEETTDNITIEILNNEIYELDDDLGFGFVVSEIELTSSVEITDYDLSSLVTDEGIRLSDTYKFENKLKTTNHDFSLLNTTDIISTSNKKATARIFVPYILATNNIVISDMKYNNTLIIELSGDKKDISTLLNKATEEEIVSKNYSFTCSKPYVEDMMKYNGEPYDSSVLSIYVFKLTCVYIKDGLTVTSATFTDSNGGVYEAYNEEWSSSKVDNILGKTIEVGDTYAAFFELYANPEDKVTYTGTIKLSFSDDSTVEIETVLD